MVYVGVSGRYLVEVEALNMAESVGNVVRHKRAPVVVPVRDENGRVTGYSLRYFPVVSGMSIAHGYQELLAKVASRMGLPVCPLCSQGIFVKHGGDEIVKRIAEMGASYARELVASRRKASPEEVEARIVGNCVVEDVGGFLYPTGQPTKRTSRFYSGYMIPSLEWASAAGMESIFHVRHDPLQSGGRTGEETGQAIYYVEAGSALYAINLGLDLDQVGCLTAKAGELQDARRRREAALTALALLVGDLGFGAKKTRFMPSVQPESMVVVVSHPFTFNPLPAHTRDYISRTVEKAANYLQVAKRASGDAFVSIYYYIDPDAPVDRPGPVDEVTVEEASSPEDAVYKAFNHLDKARCPR